MLVERGYSEPQGLRLGELASGSHLSAGGGRMRKYLIVMVATMCLVISSATTVRAQDVGWGAQRKQLKTQQKLERNALKVQQRNRKQSWNRRSVSSAERAQANHEMQRERRNLKQRQKDAMQDMKDRQKALNEMNRSYSR